MSAQTDMDDIFIIGGGINGTGIARDAAGRGLSVTLAEMNDLASGTSSASTSLLHGGLRYLEFFEFRLVREALKEREVLLRAMPHIARPMRFVLPINKAMRFDSETPTSRLLSFVMPWMRGRRPAWLIRLGLFLYDTLGGRQILPGTQALSLKATPEGAPLQDIYHRAFEYSDCWVQDARMVVLNARDAARNSARIMVRTKVTGAVRKENHWVITTEKSDGQTETHKARVLVNAGGPWVSEVIRTTLGINSAENIRLVRGSHIVVPRLFDHDKAYFFQGRDGRIIFAIPYEQDFTLIGTTDADHPDPWQKPVCTDEEADYLCAFASTYFKKPVTRDDVVWTYSGVRPLYDDGASSATAATREYVLSLDEAGAPLLNVFGGKITTYRKLAEAALAKLTGAFPDMRPDWTAGAALPGGDFPVDGLPSLIGDLVSSHPWLDHTWAARLARSYGTDAAKMLAGVTVEEDMGEVFGATITAKELDWAVDHEWVRSAEDFLWRRSKLGLRLKADPVARIDSYISNRLAARG